MGTVVQRTVASLRRQGRRARTAGLSRAVCPYRGADRDQWLRGYNDQRRKEKRK